MPKLYVVPTPIGNLGDITLRAIEILKEVEFILAEDTRHTVKLLKHLEIENRLVSFHQHNEHKALARTINDIKMANAVAIVSDAGTPGISDPGFLLIRECIRQSVEVEVLPGAVAFVPALVGSGFPSDKFCFEGFLPHKKGRQKRMLELCMEERTVVFYESPHRLVKLLSELEEHFGTDRLVCVSRELTKMHEENARGPVSEIRKHFESKTVKGEIVVVVEGAGKQ